MFPGMPAGPAGPLRMLILLHGYSGSHADWVHGCSLDQLASAHHMAIFCPSGENSFYIDDTARDALYEQYICRELPKFAREVFHISDKVEDTFIGGLSMGGYGAIRNGLKNPDVFGGILAFSSALITDGISHMPDEPQPAPAGQGGGGGSSSSGSNNTTNNGTNTNPGTTGPTFASWLAGLGGTGGANPGAGGPQQNVGSTSFAQGAFSPPSAVLRARRYGGRR